MTDGESAATATNWKPPFFLASTFQKSTEGILFIHLLHAAIFPKFYFTDHVTEGSDMIGSLWMRTPILVLVH